MKVLVTGASGYIGRHVTKELLVQGHQVVACDIVCDGIDSEAVFSDVNIFSRETDICERFGNPDLLIHLAWQHGFIHNSPAHMDNLSEHVIFLRNMAQGGCKNIAVMGTMHEIGYREGKIDENTPCSPMSMYGISKNALRQTLLLMQKEIGFNLYWLRAFYIYGDGTRGNSVFSKITRAAMEGKQEFPFTSGNNLYDFISVYDLAQQIVAAATQDQISGIINVCTGVPISLREKMEAYIKENSLNIRLNYGAFPDRPYDSPGVWGDASKIAAILGNKL